MFCTYCGSTQHVLELCPKTWQGQANRNGMRCTYCGAQNHRAAACPKLVAQHNRNPKDYIKD